MILVGTSGWQYDSWRERFYPADLPKTQWLPYFSARYPTVEVNNTFYRLPAPEVFEKWRRESAPDFVVTVKASRFITHLKRLKDPAAAIEKFWPRARRLGDKLGPVLFQLPPRFPADVPRLAEFLAHLPSEMTAAFEFRDRSWETDEVYELLDRAGYAFVLADRWGARVPSVVTGGWSYIRFHQGSRLGPFYPSRKLKRWAERIAAMPARRTYVYFNNDPEGAAIRDSRTLTRLLIEIGCPVSGASGVTEARRATG